MKKTNMRIKETLTVEDKIGFIDLVVKYNFIDGLYTPYFDEIGRINAIVEYLLDGIEISKNEDIITLYNTDEELHKLITDVMYCNREYRKWSYNAKEIIEFEKQKLLNKPLEKISQFTDMLSSVLINLEDATTALAQLKELNITNESFEELLNFTKKFEKTGLTKESLLDMVEKEAIIDLDENAKTIIDSKNAEIKALKLQNEELSKSLKSASGKKENVSINRKKKRNENN